jgi:hypothetical protein
MSGQRYGDRPVSKLARDQWIIQRCWSGSDAGPGTAEVNVPKTGQVATASATTYPARARTEAFQPGHGPSTAFLERGAGTSSPATPCSVSDIDDPP